MIAGIHCCRILIEAIVTFFLIHSLNGMMLYNRKSESCVVLAWKSFAEKRWKFSIGYEALQVCKVLLDEDWENKKLEHFQRNHHFIAIYIKLESKISHLDFLFILG